MVKEEALKLLEQAPKSMMVKSKINISLSQYDVYAIIKSVIEKMNPGEKLSPIIEKRVYQVARNQKQPRY